MLQIPKKRSFADIAFDCIRAFFEQLLSGRGIAIFVLIELGAVVACSFSTTSILVCVLCDAGICGLFYYLFFSPGPSLGEE